MQILQCFTAFNILTYCKNCGSISGLYSLRKSAIIRNNLYNAVMTSFFPCPWVYPTEPTVLLTPLSSEKNKKPSLLALSESPKK